MRNMGGLKKAMPITYLTFLVSTIAIAGIPGFSGFFSKDEILWQAFANPFHGGANIYLWATGAIAACFTAFYMFRLVFMTFFGESRINPKAKDHLHESPLVITIPLMVLGALAVVGGYIGLPKLIGDLFGGIPNYFEHWLEPVFKAGHEATAAAAAAHGGAHHSHALEWGLMGTSVVIAIIGISIAVALYVVNPSIPAKFTAAFPRLHRAVFNKWYIDELYDFLLVNPCKNLGVFLWKGFDVVVVDGIVNGGAKVVMAFGAGLRQFQTGYVHNYAFTMVLGTAVIMAFYIFR
jgi:NADH-quinone oxidoreductase subunit L